MQTRLQVWLTTTGLLLAVGSARADTDVALVVIALPEPSLFDTTEPTKGQNGTPQLEGRRLAALPLDTASTHGELDESC